MALITGKTVYVFGAGTSHHTGAPLLRDFLVAARLLYERNPELHYKESFERVFKWIDSLRGSSYYVEFDLNNLEHVFSLAEMKRQLELDQGEELCSDLRHVILETLDNTCQLQLRNGRVIPDPTYQHFIQKLHTWNDRRRQLIRKSEKDFESDAIITFNYDVMLDYAMYRTGYVPEYCLFEPAYMNKYKVLKLHGSSNWVFCRECNDKTPQVIEPTSLPSGSHYIEPRGQINFTMVTEALAGEVCKYCKKTGKLDPIIIPPTWSKLVSHPLVNVWREAVNQIRSAFQIVVIGYSMPQTDTFFQYLLTLGLASNPNLQRVFIVNSDDSEDFKNRYGRIFSRSLKDRNNLNFVDPPRTFEIYATKSGAEAIACEI